MKNLSNWRSVRVLESRFERELRQRHSLGFHGFCIGVLTLVIMWAVSHTLMVFGYDSLAGRYFITLGTAYLVYLGVLRIWGGSLAERRADDAVGNALDAADVGIDVVDALGGLRWPRGTGQAPGIRTGKGGDFGGGGATGDYGAPAGGAPSTSSSSSSSSSGFGDMAGGAFEAAASADEGAVVAIPVVAIFVIGAALFFSAGSLLLLFFGWDVLLAVAVELAFSYVTARAAVRVAREGWLTAAVRLTWKPLLGAIACAVALGAAIDHFIPSANSLPQAIKLILAKPPR